MALAICSIANPRPHLAPKSNPKAAPMKATLLVAALLLCSYFLALTPLSAAPSSQIPQAPAEAARAACMQTCFDDFLAAADACDEGVCKQCVGTYSGICILWAVNQTCVRACMANAQAALMACLAGCQ